MRLRTALAAGAVAAALAPVALAGPVPAHAVQTPQPAPAASSSAPPHPAPPSTESPRATPPRTGRQQPAAPQSAPAIRQTPPRRISPRPVPPASAVPQPFAPQPSAPRPALPLPAVPLPVVPQPTAPNPTAPNPIAPNPTAPHTMTPNAASPAAPGAGPVEQQPSCGDLNAVEFPIATRIVRGPEEYRAGGDAHEFSVELSNTTAQPCLNIHPVVVLAGQSRAIPPDRVRLEFFDGAARIWRPVTIEKTDQGEAVGAFGAGSGGFAGLSLPAGGAFSVRVRLAFPDRTTAPDAVVANAAVVQRRGADGDWVGESNDYRFDILGPEPTDRPSEPVGEPSGSRAPGDGNGKDGSAWQDAHELAATGTRPWHSVGLATAGGVLLVGAVVLLMMRRRSR
ncbi:hypothetical protein [Streptomyces wuyuanensis]|uniref:Gram-positive cocci surface proteins LPxTG domain-containing protein n=1 Tax=Streptomyces wuyuanensis TaxID=1196353 RepID=A0A1H0AXU1_9ACTN|nr:hypothetical protein [Streptomyces wuyuanensis]SDN38284.1 hypothetical protein SAMN05444921_125124 [Streptomyces wuyuanensis]